MTREVRYRASGVQAAAVKGCNRKGWGGDGMSWAIQPGLPGSDGAVAGTLLASRLGWDRVEKEVLDRWNWGRFTGRTVVGTSGKKVLIITV